MTDEIDETAGRLSPDEQKQLALRIARIISPYGVLDPDVIDPDEFRTLADTLASAYDVGDLASVERVRAACSTLLDSFEEEPPGNGFYALAAVVALEYAAYAVVTDPNQGVMWAMARLEDVLFNADDEGWGGLYDQTRAWLRHLDSAGEEQLRSVVEADARRRSGDV